MSDSRYCINPKQRIIAFSSCFLIFLFGSISASAQPVTSEKQALEIVQNELHKAKTPLIVVEKKEYPFGWAFRYATKEYVETKDPMYILVGGGPIVVNRDGTIKYLGDTLPPTKGGDVAIYYKGWIKNHPKEYAAWKKAHPQEPK